MIINPPSDMTEDWENDDYERFYQDSFDVMAKIEPRLFRFDNVRMTATHRDEGWKVDRDADEGEHMHISGDARDTDGRYCGNVLDASLCVRINREYPALMRTLGWELDDLDCTDWARMGKDEHGEYIDPGYREQRKAKARSGRSVNKYVADAAKARWDAAIEREAALDDRAIKLRSREVEANVKEKQAARREKETERREQAVNERERALETREAEARENIRRMTEAASKALQEAESVLSECCGFREERRKSLVSKVSSSRRSLGRLVHCDLLQQPTSGTDELSF